MILNNIILYIDPATGGLILSVIISVVMTVIFSVKNIYYKTVSFFSGSEYKGSCDFSDKLVFFCEGKNYWNVFKPVVDELIKQKQNFIYLSADKEDPGLKINSIYCNSQYLGNMNQSFFLLNKLKAKVCVTTTPQLDILAWKRSKNVKHYCYLSHSPTGLSAYKKFAFDYYDSILCENDYKIENIRQLERDRKSRKKVLMKTGCTYYDLTIKKKIGQKKHILIAPTWGDRSFFSTNGESLINLLLNGKHKVLFRPHPQSWISDAELLDYIISKFKHHKLFEIDRSVDNNAALADSKLLITDTTSGIIYDVAFLYKIPILTVEFKWSDGGYESSNIEKPSSTEHLLKDVGITISEKEIVNINEIVKDVFNKKITNEIIDKHIFNFQKAGKVASKQILSIFKDI